MEKYLFQTAGGGTELQANLFLGMFTREEIHSQPFKQSGAMNEQKLIQTLTRFQVFI